MKTTFIRWALLGCLIPMCVTLSAQDANQIIRDVNQKFRKVKDYVVDVNIKTNIAFIKIPLVKAKLYYKQPDQLHIESKGIAILPRQGVDQLFKTLANPKSYTAMVQGTDKIGSINVTMLNIIPVEDTSDLILGKLWIDTERSLILKSQLTTRTNGTILVEYAFGKQADFALPDQLTFTIDTKKFKIPKAVAADLNNYNTTPSTTEQKKASKGKIFMNFSNYLINKGIDEKVFRK